MSINTESLELNLSLMLQGILPPKPGLFYLDYSEVKSKIKKQTGFELTAKEINHIFSIVLTETTDLAPNPLLKRVEQAQEIIKQNQYDVAQKALSVIQKNISQEQLINIACIIIELSSLFNTTNEKLNKTLFNTRSDWSGDNYERKKSSLNILFKRELKKEEFHLIAQTWCHYVAFVKDILNPDNYVAEQIKELKAYYFQRIQLLEDKIQYDQMSLDTLQSLERFIYIDLDVEKTLLEKNLNELKYLKSVEERLRQGNGDKLSKNNIQEKAYFSIFFLGELLGLSEPEIPKYGNPLLTFLDILTGWSAAFLDKDATRKRISTIYGRYKSFKRQANIAQLMDDLKNMMSTNHNLRHIINQFESNILQLSIKPRFQSITQDA